MTVQNAGTLPFPRSRRFDPTLHRPDSRYISFSTKFSSYLSNIILKNHAQAHLLVLSGGAGLGKTVTLQNEFLLPLARQNIILLCFSFLSGENIHNHFFLRDLVNNLVSYLESRGIFETPHGLKKLQHFFTNPGVTSIDYKVINRLFLDIIANISDFLKVVLVFEDAHFARENFSHFINEATDYEHKLNSDIILTTRLTQGKHEFKSSPFQKWLYFKELPEKKILRYMDSIRGEKSASSPFAEYAINLSNGNPFFIKELCFLEAEKLIPSAEFISEQLIAASSNRLNITLLRFKGLTESQKAFLKIFAVIGMECKKSDLASVLAFMGIGSFDSTLTDLKEKAFVSLDNHTLRFQHQFIYDSIFSSFTNSELESIDRKLFRYYFQKQHRDIERLAHHSFRAGMHGLSCFLAKRIAEKFHTDNQFELAALYYERHAELLPLCSSARKVAQRTTDCFIPLHATYLILGYKEKAEKISNSLSLLAQTTTPWIRAQIYAVIARSYWTSGNLAKARQHTAINVDVSRDLADKAPKIGALVRYGTLCSEMGDFRTASEANDEAISLIAADEHHEKFGLLVYAHSSITSVQSICHAELGDYQKAQDSIRQSLDAFDSIDDSFSRLFIVTYTGYALLLTGNLKAARKYLLAGADIFNRTKASLLGPVCFSLLGMCLLRLGEIDQGIASFKISSNLLGSTSQRHKTGMIDLLYLESLLICFDTKKFAELIDLKTAECMATEQKSYVAWMHFLKAVYYLFYKKSETGFIGALAKANMIAQSLDMGLLQQNIARLTSFDKSGIFGFADHSEFTMSFFDKSQFFYDLTHNVRPMNYRK